MSSQVYCFNCKYRKRAIDDARKLISNESGGGLLCSHPETRDLVLGLMVACEYLRVIGKCGKEGKYYEAE